MALTKGSAGYRLRLSMGTLFGSQPRLCPGGSDLSLHANEGADSPVAEIPAPKLNISVSPRKVTGKATRSWPPG